MVECNHDGYVRPSFEKWEKRESNLPFGYTKKDKVESVTLC
jgi:hypothetical protein